MRTRPVVILTAMILAVALALFVVAWVGQQGRVALRNDLASTQAELAQTRTELDAAKAAAASARSDANAATARADRLQARVDALEAALRRQGVDPGTVVVRAVTPSTTAAGRPSAAAPSPSSSRPSSRPPRPAPSPSPSTRQCVPLPVLGCR